MKRFLASLRDTLQKRFCCQIPSRYLDTVYFPHPVGIVIGSQVHIGSNVTIYQNVTVGRRGMGIENDQAYPTIGNDVVVYAGAVIAGGISIGDGCIVGANSIVSRDIPPHCTVFGYNEVRARTTAP